MYSYNIIIATVRKTINICLIIIRFINGIQPSLANWPLVTFNQHTCSVCHCQVKLATFNN